MPKKEIKCEIVKAPKKPKRALAVNTKKDLSIENLLIKAVEQGTPVETMERLLAMRKDLKAEKAKEAFDSAMAKFQSECPIIKKKKAGGQTKSGQVAYYYAPIDLIVSQVRPFISKNGFSYSIQTKTLKGLVKAICIVKHELGHSESSDMTVPLSAGTNIMSAPQITASALTFAKRYAFCNAFGIMTGDEDNDATPQKTTPEKKATVADTQKMVIVALGRAKTSDEVIHIDKETQKSKRFSKTFKDSVKKLANQKVDEINK